jgi:four helix bundle protein
MRAESVSFKSYKDLQVWQRGMDLAQRIYELTRAFPQKEVYALSNQMQRAAVSIPANVAEGHARDSTREFLHYISIALGSLAELETHLILAGRLSYLGESDVSITLSSADELGRMLRGLQKKLKARLAPSLQPQASISGSSIG